MADGLIPEQRMDKTGKVVTRHVRTAPAGSSAPRKALPSPTAASHPKRLARDAMKRLKEKGIDLYSGSAGNKMLYYLASVSPDLLESNVQAACDAVAAERTVWVQFLGDVHPPSNQQSDYELAWKKYLCLGQRIPTAVLLEGNERERIHHPAKNLIQVVNRAYPEELESSDFLRAASIVLHLRGENSLFKRLTSKNEDRFEDYRPDIEFISQHVDDVEKLIPVLREREATDPDTVAMLLESESLSLSDGML